MFTIEQIMDAHAKVKSGADFPGYILALKQLSVASYQTYVTDGHTDFYGAGNYTATSAAKYAPKDIAGQCNREQFEKSLLAHQQGHTDYPAFCTDCAVLGIDKWIVSLSEMTCSYFDKNGSIILVEQIPG